MSKADVKFPSGGGGEIVQSTYDPTLLERSGFFGIEEPNITTGTPNIIPVSSVGSGSSEGFDGVINLSYPIDLSNFRKGDRIVLVAYGADSRDKDSNILAAYIKTTTQIYFDLMPSGGGTQNLSTITSRFAAGCWVKRVQYEVGSNLQYGSWFDVADAPSGYVNKIIWGFVPDSAETSTGWAMCHLNNAAGGIKGFIKYVDLNEDSVQSGWTLQSSWSSYFPGFYTWTAYPIPGEDYTKSSARYLIYVWASARPAYIAEMPTDQSAWTDPFFLISGDYTEIRPNAIASGAVMSRSFAYEDEGNIYMMCGMYYSGGNPFRPETYLIGTKESVLNGPLTGAVISTDPDQVIPTGIAGASSGQWNQARLNCCNVFEWKGSKYCTMVGYELGGVNFQYPNQEKTIGLYKLKDGQWFPSFGPTGGPQYLNPDPLILGTGATHHSAEVWAQPINNEEKLVLIHCMNEGSNTYKPVRTTIITD